MNLKLLRLFQSLEKKFMAKKLISLPRYHLDQLVNKKSVEDMKTLFGVI